MVVSPEFSGRPDTGLHFVDDEEDVVFFGKGTERAEEGRRGVVIAAFGLDGFDYYSAGGKVVCSYEALDVC